MTPALFDQHLHSHHSFDCETPPADNVRAAIERGLAGLTFTEHFDTHPDEWPHCRYDDAAYSDTIASLREEFGQRLFIGKGIEICYQPERMDFILEHLAKHQFDLIILSVHWAGGRQLGELAHWKDLTPIDGTRLYLEQVLAAVRQAGRLRQKHGQRCFDVLGHLDFVKRYTHRFFKEVCVSQFGHLIDEICHACLEADLTPEVNTSTLRQGLPEPMPGPDTLARYAAAGGTAMSLGSDAHTAQAIGQDFNQARTLLQHAGIRHLALFKGRQLQDMELTEGD